MLEIGRQTRGVGTKVLLQPFAYGVADRSAGLAIDLFAVVVDSAVHGGVRFFVVFNEVKQEQDIGGGSFLWSSPLSRLIVKVVLTPPSGSPHRQDKDPARRRR